MSVRVYAIRNRTSDSVYVGSTRRQLPRRFTEHKSKQKQHLNGTTNHCSSSQILECPTAYIELLETCEVGARYERERWWVENTPNCINKLIPGRTIQEFQHEWYLENKERRCEQQRAYYQVNREKVREQQRAYYQAKKLKSST